MTEDDGGRACNSHNKPVQRHFYRPGYLTVIPLARVGYEMVTNVISNEREWNNCFIKNAPKI